MKKTIQASLVLSAVLVLSGCLSMLFDDGGYDSDYYNDNSPTEEQSEATSQQPVSETKSEPSQKPDSTPDSSAQTTAEQPTAEQETIPAPGPQSTTGNTNQTVPVSQAIPEHEWIRISEPISSTVEMFHYIRLPWLNQFEPDREYEMLLEILKPEARHWNITLHVRHPRTGDFHPIDFSGSEDLRWKTLDTSGYRIGELGEYYYEVYIPEVDQTRTYGKYPDYYMGFDIKADAFEHVYEVDKFRWTQEMVEQRLQIQPIADTVFGSHADVLVTAAPETSNWTVTASAGTEHVHENQNDYYTKRWEVTRGTSLTYDNGFFRGSLSLANDVGASSSQNKQNLWLGDRMEYGITVTIPTTEEVVGGRFRVEAENEPFEVLTDGPLEYSQSQAENFVFYRPFDNPWYEANSSQFRILLKPPARTDERWKYNLLARIKGSGEDYIPLLPPGDGNLGAKDIENPFDDHPIAKIYGHNNWENAAAYFPLNNGPLELIEGDTIQYYIRLECGATHQTFYIGKENPFETVIPFPKTDLVDRFACLNLPLAVKSDPYFNQWVYANGTSDETFIDDVECSAWYRRKGTRNWIPVECTRAGNSFNLSIPYREYPVETVLEYYVELDRGDQRARIGSDSAPMSFKIVDAYPENAPLEQTYKPVEF